MDTVDYWVVGCEWILGELLGQVYGEEYLRKYNLVFQKFPCQGGMRVGKVLLEIIFMRCRNMTRCPRLHLPRLCLLWVLSLEPGYTPSLAKALSCLWGVFIEIVRKCAQWKRRGLLQFIVPKCPLKASWACRCGFWEATGSYVCDTHDQISQLMSL